MRDKGPDRAFLLYFLPINMQQKTTTLLLFLALSGALSAQSVNWANDIAPIIYDHCTNCHRAGGIGNFSLTDYPSVFTMRDEVADAVINRRMPPWKADPAYRHYTGENYLTDSEIALVEQWVAANAPSGNVAEAPAPPVFTEGSAIGIPDMVLQTPVYTMTATQDEYRCFVVPSGLTQTAYLAGLEVIPGNHQAVHHVLIYEDVTGQGKILDQQTPDAGYVSFGGPGFNARLVGAWVPGNQARLLPENMGIKLTGGADLIVQVHFPGSATGMTDQSTLNLFFTPNNQNVREVGIAPLLNHSSFSLVNGPLQIPANTVKEFQNKYTVPQTSSIIAVGPHMHLIGRSMKCFGVTLQNDTIPLINIPSWDFHWQGNYTFQKLQKVPIGTKLYGFAVYDNTENNPFQPSSPPQNVALGEATTDEMMLTYFIYTSYLPGDENIILDSTLLTSALPVLPVQSSVMPSVKVTPNPVRRTAEIQFDLSHPDAITMIIANESGKIIRQIPAQGDLPAGTHFQQIDLTGLPPGNYTVQLKNKKGEGRIVNLVKI